MTISYPITLPSLGIVSATIRHANRTVSTRSIFTGEKQSQRYDGELIEYDVTLRPRHYNNAGAIRAALVSLCGDVGTFLFGDPDFLARGPIGVATGTPLVDGVGTKGASTLATKGWTVSTQSILAAGDFFQLGAASAARLYMNLTDADADSAGRATLNIWPRLRTAPADNDPIVVTGAVGLFELTGPITEMSSDAASVFAFAFGVREAL